MLEICPPGPGRCWCVPAEGSLVGTEWEKSGCTMSQAIIFWTCLPRKCLTLQTEHGPPAWQQTAWGQGNTQQTGIKPASEAELHPVLSDWCWGGCSKGGRVWGGCRKPRQGSHPPPLQPHQQRVVQIVVGGVNRIDYLAFIMCQMGQGFVR